MEKKIAILPSEKEKHSKKSFLPIHTNIQEKLQYFYCSKKIPNIVFHGQSGSGKKTLVHYFINMIYNNDREKIKNYVLHVNCAHGKGIEFIREELKFFAKTHIQTNGGDIFKSIVLTNADKLTVDAQSALRRCIELFNHTTRFFIIVEDKYKILKPILSRFCEIYVPDPLYEGKNINLYTHQVDETFSFMEDIQTKRVSFLKKTLKKYKNNALQMGEYETLIDLSSSLYEKSYSALDLIHLFEKTNIVDMNEERRQECCFAFYKMRKEFRNEKLLILIVLHFMLVDNTTSLEILSFF
jgi:GTPase SAR1 family protein